jgi:hypothetical protein
VDRLPGQRDDRAPHGEGGTAVLYYVLMRALASLGHEERAILVCGTGIGMAITANKVPGVRAAQAHDVYSASLARPPWSSSWLPHRSRRVLRGPISTCRRATCRIAVTTR